MSLNESRRMGRKRKNDEYLLLSGSTELARGSQSAMKRQRTASVQYLSAAEQQALSIVPVRSQKRKHSPSPEEVIDVEEEALKERTKRLRLTTAQDTAYEEASRLDREKEERERQEELERERELAWNREWRREGRKPEHRAKVFAELFERKFK